MQHESTGPSDVERLENLLRGRRPCVTISTFEEEHALGLARDAALNLGRPVWVWSAAGGIQEGLVAESPPVPNTEDPIAAFQHVAGRDDKPVYVMLDLVPHLGQHRTLRAFRNLLNQIEKNGTQLVLVDHSEDVPPVVSACATPFEPSLPDAQELERMVRSVLRRIHQDKPIEIDITRGGLDTIVRNLRGLTRRQAEQVIADTVTDDARFDVEDINHVLAEKRRIMASDGLLEYVEAPTQLGQVGGLRKLKKWLAQREDVLGEKARAFGLIAPRGVLMLGVQGAGKSLCAKAIATAWQRPLLRMDVGGLYDRYVGESERRLRAALHQAEMMAPIILWIDEIEKAFASAAAQSTDGGLSKRMFGALLTWMQEHEHPVFLVATANDIEALPPELLRKGRFDEIFFVDLPGEDVRRQILEIHLRKRNRDPAGFDVAALAVAADGFSGAEIEQAVVSGLHEAFAAGEELSDAHLKRAIESSPPLAVTRAEQVEALRRWGRERCTPAD